MKDRKLTDTSVQKLKASPKSGTKQLMWDPEIRGFGAYRTSRGSISFLYQYRFNGSPTRSIKIGNHGTISCTDARRIAAGYAQQKLAGIDPISAIKDAEKSAARSDELILSNYFEAYLNRRRTKKPMSAKREKVFRRDLLAHLGDVRLDDLTVDDVEAFEEALGARGPSIIRSGLVCLRTVLMDAVRRGKVMRNEAHDFLMPGINRRSRRIDEAELKLILAAAADIGDVRGEIIEVLVRTAKRKEEIARMRWQELNLPKETWTIPKSRAKGAQQTVVMLPRQVIDIIQRQQPDRRKRIGPVFTLNGRTAPAMGSQVKDLIDANLHRRIELAMAADADPISVDHYTVHDMRKVSVTTLHGHPFNVSLDVLNAVLTHSNRTSLDDTYFLTRLEIEAGKALQLWNDHLDTMLGTTHPIFTKATLEPMTVAERKSRLKPIRAGWQKRTDQVKAEANRAATEEARRLRRRKKRSL